MVSIVLHLCTNVAAPIIPSHIAQNQRNDVFVGNLAFGTTEDQLYQAFTDLGRIIKVRMVTDENGKPRGFAFIEFEDPASALSAIRNMNDYELNGRRIRVNFSNSSHLETLAGKLGMDLTSMSHTSTTLTMNSMMGMTGGSSAAAAIGGTATTTMATTSRNIMEGTTGTHTVAEALKGLSKGECYDIIHQLKMIAERDPEEARKIISAHPQLPEAILYLMSKLDMIQTPIPTVTATNSSTTATMMTMTDNVNQIPKLPTTNPPSTMASSSSSSLAPSQPMVTPVTATAANTTANISAAARPADPRARVDPRTGAATSAVGGGGGGVARIDPRMVAATRPTATTTTGPVSMNTPAIITMAPPPVVQPIPMVGGVPAVFNPYMMPPPPMTTPMVGVVAATAPPPPPPPPTAAAVTPSPSWVLAAQILGLDLDLVQKVMALTPQQIGQLPPDKQQSILALRQQITNAITQSNQQQQQQQQRYKMES